jgi:hypothetical protein
VILAAMIAGSAPAARAVVLGGSLRTSLYAQKSHLGADVLTYRQGLDTRTTLLETARLDALQLGLPGLSFHTAFTATNVLNLQSAKETRFRLFRGYLQAARRRGAMQYDARFGRQWVMAGVGTGVIDGASLLIGHSGWGDVTGYFGSLGADRLTRTSKFWVLEKPSESRSFGGRARLTHPLGPVTPTLAVSYGEADRKPHDKLVTDAQLIGVNGELRLTRGRTGLGWLEHLRLWGETRRDLIFGRIVSATGGAEYQEGPKNLHAWMEYDRRQPNLPATSFFAPFDSRPVHQLRGGVGRQVYKALSVDLSGDLIDFQGSQGEKGAELLFSGYGYTVGYRLHNGYGGSLSGLVLYGHQDLGGKITLDASANLTQYKYGEVTSVEGSRVDDDELTGILAAGYRLHPNLTLTAQVEGLQNAEFRRDARFLGIVHWRFRSVL